MTSSAVLLLLFVAVGQTQAVPEDLSHWEFYRELQTAGPSPGQLCDLAVPPGVFDHAQPDLADLRLCDPRGNSVPYALRILRERNEQEVIAAREFNKSFDAATGSAQVSLDLGETPREHTAIVVNLGGDDFRRSLKLEGSSDGTKWSVVLERVHAIRIAAAGQSIDVRRFSYPRSRFRYLRLQVSRDTSKSDDKPAIESIDVLHTVRIPGEAQTVQGSVAMREPVPTPMGPGSAWLIDFGHLTPLERIRVEADDATFARPYVLEVANPGEPTRWLAAGEWRRRQMENPAPLEITFPEVLARRVKFIVTDSRNPPLSLGSVTGSAPLRQLVFRLPTDSSTPLRLYHGNSRAAAPNYDFAATLPVVMDPVPRRVSADVEMANPEYRPMPKPWTERHPWLVDGVLAVAGGMLLVVLILLGKEAIRQADTRREAVAPANGEA